MNENWKLVFDKNNVISCSPQYLFIVFRLVNRNCLDIRLKTTDYSHARYAVDFMIDEGYTNVYLTRVSCHFDNLLTFIKK